MNNLTLSEVQLDSNFNNDEVMLKILTDDNHLLITQRILSKKHQEFQDGHIAELHYHNCYEMELVLDGEMVQNIHNNIYTLNPNEFVLLSPHDIHSCELNADTAIILNLQFHPDIFNEKIQKILNCTKFPIIGKLSDELIELFGRILNILNSVTKSMHNGLIYHKLVYTEIEALLLYIIDTNSALNINYDDINSKNNSSILKSIEYIKKNFSSHLSVHKVASICGYTPNYFSSRFKKITGKSFVEYLNNERLVYAYNRIITTNETIETISVNSGFNDLKHFYNCFYKKFNSTPGAIRKSTKS